MAITILNISPDILYALSWAILHSFWQVALVYMVMRLILHYLPDNYANSRYYVATCSLSLAMASFIYTLINKYSLYSSNGEFVLTPMQNTNTTGGNIQLNTTVISKADSIIAWFNTHADVIDTIYAVGITILLFRVFINLFIISKLKNRNTVPANKEWTDILDRCIYNLKLTTKVKLLFSSKVDVPMVMGAVKPVILIPVALVNQLSVQQAEAILLHELAHVRRNDYIINVIQMVIETLMFFNPFTWLISSVIRKEREKCCDDLVVAHTTDKLPYVKALAALEEYRQYPSRPSLAAKNSNNHLLSRIKRIMEMRKNNINYGQLAAVLLTIILLGATITFIAPEVTAQTKDNKGKSKIEVFEDVDNVPAEPKSVPAPATPPPAPKAPIAPPAPPAPVANSAAFDRQMEEDIEKEVLQATKSALAAANQALENLDIEQIVSEAFESIDWGEINASINDSLKKVDWAEIKGEMHQAMEEAKQAMAEARIEQREAMARARKEQKEALALAHEKMEESRKHIEKSRENARTRAVQARQRAEEARERADEARERAEAARERANGARERAEKSRANATRIRSKYDRLLNSMEKDGLINKSNGYKIEKKGNTLYIDGIKQSKQVMDKYEHMMPYNKLTIKGNKNSISINQKD